MIPFPKYSEGNFPEVKDRYFFQRGKIHQFLEQVSKDTKEWKGELGNIAPGIERISYVKLNERDDKILSIKAIDNVNEELLII